MVHPKKKCCLFKTLAHPYNCCFIWILKIVHVELRSRSPNDITTRQPSIKSHISTLNSYPHTLLLQTPVPVLSPKSTVLQAQLQFRGVHSTARFQHILCLARRDEGPGEKKFKTRLPGEFPVKWEMSYPSLGDIHQIFDLENKHISKIQIFHGGNHGERAVKIVILWLPKMGGTSKFIL